MISLFHELRVQVPQGGPEPPPGAALPMKWDVISMWLRTDDDAGKTYEERFALTDAAGKATGLSGASTFEMSAPRHQTVITMLGFPLVPGSYTLKLWLTEKGQPESDPIAEYPLALAFSPA